MGYKRMTMVERMDIFLLLYAERFNQARMVRRVCVSPSALHRAAPAAGNTSTSTNATSNPAFDP
jgi:hypothetical protein